MMLVPAIVLVALSGQAEPAAAVKETAYARVALAQSIGRDPAIHAAVVASNAVAETPEQIRRRDAYWIANTHDPLRQTIVRAPCSDKVRALVKADVVVVEAFVMNNRGTLVCSIAETSDYWQGDEPKGQKTHVDGKDGFVEGPAFDVSTGENAIQGSVPAFDPGNRAGAGTLTLKLHRATTPQH